MKIYCIDGRCGWYEDSYTWVVRAFTSEKKAKRLHSLLTRISKLIVALPGEDYQRKVPEGKKPVFRKIRNKLEELDEQGAEFFSTMLVERIPTYYLYDMEVDTSE